MGRGRGGEGEGTGRTLGEGGGGEGGGSGLRTLSRRVGGWLGTHFSRGKQTAYLPSSPITEER